MRFESAGQTHIGRRPHNEDAYCVLPERGLFVVADGLGGQEGGEVASQCVVDTFAGFSDRLDRDRDGTWPDAVDPARSREENYLAACTALAQRTLRVRRVGKLKEMASTVVALAVGERWAAVAHVGDSRLYRLREGRLESLTRDHSLIEELRAAGREPPGNPANLRHLITRALGTENAEPTLQRLETQPGDIFLLCSDGLYEPLGPEVLREQLRAPSSAQAACDALVSAAYEAGGRDNITAVVLRVAV
ncbi:PP2C family protein-serine/threonine phosphatase [Corallococcus sp. 4LFB]|uniref:PP2C family protein-serine/threonine phosphatase n=1 Tax=Corallococcus sp. 4LFB TaxID=3383249 RepID=UPI003976979F